MTKESALLNASLVHSLMVNLGYFKVVSFDIYNSGCECLVYGQYVPFKGDTSVFGEKFNLPATELAYCEDRSIKGADEHVFSFTWHWDE